MSAPINEPQQYKLYLTSPGQKEPTEKFNPQTNAFVPLKSSLPIYSSYSETNTQTETVRIHASESDLDDEDGSMESDVSESESDNDEVQLHTNQPMEIEKEIEEVAVRWHPNEPKTIPTDKKSEIKKGVLFDAITENLENLQQLHSKTEIHTSLHQALEKATSSKKQVVGMLLCLALLGAIALAITSQVHGLDASPTSIGGYVTGGVALAALGIGSLYKMNETRVLRKKEAKAQEAKDSSLTKFRNGFATKMMSGIEDEIPGMSERDKPFWTAVRSGKNLEEVLTNFYNYTKETLDKACERNEPLVNVVINATPEENRKATEAQKETILLAAVIIDALYI